jgi:molecular chaperone GrpE
MSKTPKQPEDISPELAADMADNANAPTEDEQTRLRAELARCQAELADAKHDTLRAHADFDNFRKRMRAERDAEFARGSDRVLADLLPVLDDFERALAAQQQVPDANDALQQGVEMIYRRLVQLLERYGITAMAVEGVAFDPKYHDAVTSVVIADVPEHTIVGEILRGYLKNGEVFRPARVAVAVPPDEA